MKKKSILLFILMLVASFALAACAPATEEPTDEPETEETTDGEAEAPAEEEEEMEEDDMAEDDMALEGDVIADGSSTVFPVTSAVAEEFRTVAPDVNVSVGLSGTGGGFSKFCPGETDIQDASRPIREEEAELCEENGVPWTEFLVALDGLSVVVNPENDFVECLNTEQLAQMFAADSEVTTWADVNPDWPAEEIIFYVPDPDSGTRDYFVEAILEDVMGDEADVRQDENTTNSSDDNVLLTGVGGDEFAIGFFGYAYFAANQDAVNVVPIENADGDCVAPNDETVQGGTYNPLSRPLFIYTNNNSMREKPQVAAFVEFYMSEDGAPAIMGDVGYSLPPEGTFETNLELVEQILAGEDPQGTMMGGDDMATGDVPQPEVADGDLGSESNPIIFSFVPSADANEVLTSADAIIEVLAEKTGLAIESVVPTAYVGAIEAMCDNESQVSALNTFSYVVASERGCAEVALVSVRFGSPTYAGQIITRADSGIESVEDLAGSTFCRPDPLSTSGWIIPSITLRAAGVDPDADLSEVRDSGGHDGVVRAVYEGDCDAGATFVDARGNIEEEYGDVFDQVVVIEESIPIPNDTVSFTPEVPDEIREAIVAALISMTQNEDELALLDDLYSWSGLEQVDDSFYDPFRQVLDTAGVDVEDFVE